MKAFPIIAFALLAHLVTSSQSSNLSVGQSDGAQLAYVEDVKLISVPFYSREKNVYYGNPENRLIKGIFAIDNRNTTATPSITSGGVGFSFSNVRLKGESGKALDYQVRFYV